MLRKLLLVIACLALPGLAAAAELVKVKGEVQVFAADGKLRKSAAAGDQVKPGEMLRTMADSQVVIRQEGGRYSVLNSNGTLKIQESDAIEHLRGAIFYVFRKLSSSNADARYTVSTPVATIGIRGTRFLVKAEGAAGDVAVTEGVVSMTAKTGSAFSIEKLPENMSFDEYLQSQERMFRGFQTDEFMAWKQRELESFALFKQQFFVTANQSVSVSGSKVRYERLSAEDARLIEELDALVREQESRDRGR